MNWNEYFFQHCELGDFMWLFRLIFWNNSTLLTIGEQYHFQDQEPLLDASEMCLSTCILKLNINCENSKRHLEIVKSQLLVVLVIEKKWAKNDFNWLKIVKRTIIIYFTYLYQALKCRLRQKVEENLHVSMMALIVPLEGSITIIHIRRLSSQFLVIWNYITHLYT